MSATYFPCFEISDIFGVVHKMGIYIYLQQKNITNGQSANFCIGMELCGNEDARCFIILSTIYYMVHIYKNYDENNNNGMLSVHGQCYPTLFW